MKSTIFQKPAEAESEEPIRPTFAQLAEPEPPADLIPDHYSKPVSPWDLEMHMESSGDAFVDSRRSDAIEYAFRLKGDLLGDLKKARHCLDVAIRKMENAGSPERREPEG